MQNLALQVRPRKEREASTLEPVLEQSQQEVLGSVPNTPFSQDDIEGLQGEDDDDDNEAGDKTGDTDQQQSAHYL